MQALSDEPDESCVEIVAVVSARETSQRPFPEATRQRPAFARLGGGRHDLSMTLNALGRRPLQRLEADPVTAEFQPAAVDASTPSWERNPHRPLALDRGRRNRRHQHLDVLVHVLTAVRAGVAAVGSAHLEG